MIIQTQECHMLARQSLLMRLYRLFVHGMLGIILILPPLLGEEAEGADLQINHAANQTQQVMTQTVNQTNAQTEAATQSEVAGDLNKPKKPNIARRERDMLVINTDAMNTGTQNANKIFLTTDGSLLITGDDEHMSDVSYGHLVNAEPQPAVILLMQASDSAEIPEPEQNIIRINAQTIRQ